MLRKFRKLFLVLYFCKKGYFSMENIVRTIRVYYPVSDEALATLAHGFEKQVFPVKTLIIRAGQFDRQVHFIEKGMTRSYTLHDGKEITTWFSMEGDVACGSWIYIGTKQALNTWKHWKKHWSILFPLKRLMSCISQI